MSLLEKKGQRARPSVSRSDSPLQRLRLRASLTTTELARQFAVSTATITRWLAGDRAAPRRFVSFLHRVAAGDPAEIAAAQRRYVERRRRHQDPPTLEIALPPGIEPEEARRLALEAIRNATARVRAQVEVGSP